MKQSIRPSLVCIHYHFLGIIFLIHSKGLTGWNHFKQGFIKIIVEVVKVRVPKPKAGHMNSTQLEDNFSTSIQIALRVRVRGTKETRRLCAGRGNKQEGTKQEHLSPAAFRWLQGQVCILAERVYKQVGKDMFNGLYKKKSLFFSK